MQECQQESLLQVCAVLRQVPEEITVFGDDIERMHKRALLNALVDTAPAVLIFSYAALSTAFEAAMKASAAGDAATAGEQLAVLRAVLGALQSILKCNLRPLLDWCSIVNQYAKVGWLAG